MSTEVDKNAGLLAFSEPVVTTFPNLLEAKAVKRNGKDTGEPKFSINAEIDPTTQPELARAVKAKGLEVARAKWPGRDFAGESDKIVRDPTSKQPILDANGAPMRKIPTFLFPWSNGNDLADAAKANNKDREFSRGKLVLTARSKFRPRMSAIVNGALADYETDELVKANIRLFYSGVEALIEVQFKAYDKVGEGADGVTAYIQRVVSLNRGKKVATGGGPSAAEVFSGYLGSISNIDPTAGSALDDEIPF